jgi:hypothetical protein|tara:strand:- start:192 stop:695 length:504 start_codon:yes stop_codon:yes gene_type:complete
MGSSLCTNGPWFCIGEPDYEAPKRAFEKMMQHHFPEYEFGGSEEIEELDREWSEGEATSLFDDLDMGWYRHVNDFRIHNSSGYDMMGAVEQMESIIQSFPYYMSDNRATLEQRFANGAVMFLAAGEDYGSYGQEVADESNNCDNRWFLMTGWEPASAFNLTPKEVEE